jgi:hypothetical protein
MKRTILGLATILIVFLAVLAVLTVHPIRRVKAIPACSDSTLNGYYAWTEFGSEPEDAKLLVPPSFWVESALVNFNGTGGFSGSDIYYIENGRPDPQNPSELTGGTYTVNSDCSVSMTYTWQGKTYADNGVVLLGGTEIRAVEQSDKHDTTGQVIIKEAATPI